MAGQVVYVDARKAREFAEALSGTTAFYRRAIDRLESHVSRLGKSWQDEQFQDFVREVKTLKEGLSEYISEAERAHSHLGEMATRAEEYQRHQQR